MGLSSNKATGGKRVSSYLHPELNPSVSQNNVILHVIANPLVRLTRIFEVFRKTVRYLCFSAPLYCANLIYSIYLIKFRCGFNHVKR